MKLRSILQILSLLAFISASSAGIIYYRFLKEYATKEAERHITERLQATKKNLSTFFSENVKPVRLLAAMPPLVDAMDQTTPETLRQANALLDLYKQRLDVETCYLMDDRGNTIASSNRNSPDSFVGINFSFRPYFQQAIQGLPSSYLALGTASRKRGAYYSYPVYRENEDTPLGIVVIKASIYFVEKELTQEPSSIQLVVSPLGVIFISSHPDWLYHLLWRPGPNDLQQLRKTRQFGNGPWRWTGLSKNGRRQVVDASGKAYLYQEVDIDNYPDWKIVHLYDQAAASNIVSESLSKIVLPVIVILCTLLGLSISFLYSRASLEIVRRRSVEGVLRKSEERYRSLYHHTPAMLHSIDPNGRLISVSDYWSEVLGYTREEVQGKKLTDYLTPASRKYAEETVFPAFFKNGFIKNVPYQFVKKNGEIIETQLSAISEGDEHRRTVRSLAVSIDVSERNRAERALKEAKEALSRYSKDLEEQVRNRTREISGILKYSPAVIYIKDANGKYSMVNSRFEKLFGICSSDVRGKTDPEFLSVEVAEQFLKNDDRVLHEKQSLQVEEVFVIDGRAYTYLSTKFPLYDDRGRVSGVCGIATNITVLKKAQEQLRRLSAGIMNAQEQERAYLARELHDELGQVLTALRMDAVWIQKRVRQTDPTLAARSLTMGELIDTTIENVRNLAIRLRPGVLDHLGLVEAIEWVTTDFEKRYGITSVFQHTDGPDIRGNIATAAYRITQEALTNVARHASATRTEVTMSIVDGRLTLTIADNGVGFDPETLGDSAGLGMTNMRERATLVGGVFEVQSTAGKGTRICFTVPLSASNQK